MSRAIDNRKCIQKEANTLSWVDSDEEGISEGSSGMDNDSVEKILSSSLHYGGWLSWTIS